MLGKIDPGVTDHQGDEEKQHFRKLAFAEFGKYHCRGERDGGMP